MPLVKLDIAPGIFNEDSDLAAERRWKDGDKVRFYKKFPEKIGGWEKRLTSQFLGVCRSMLPWINFEEEKWIAIGTHLKLYVYGTVFTDITPIRSTGTINANPFSTTISSTTVTVTDTSHGALVNDFVTFSGAAAVGGITINGEYQIQSIVDADTYTITHSSAATSTATGGGASVTAEYQINTGGVDGLFGLGWGAVTWGSSTWGTARSASNLFFAPRSWSFSNWGEDLIANPRGGGVYVWDASTGISSRATVITNAPTYANFILVTPDSRHLVAYGASDSGGNRNRLNIRWCSREDYTSWTPAATNTAGDKLLDTGTEILAAVRTSREIIIFTDESAYSQQFIGGNDVFSFNHLGDGIGIRGPGAVAEVADTLFWMGENDFFQYDGQLTILPCDVKQYIFDNITVNQRQKVVAGTNRQFNEVWWFYPRTGNDECSHYVTYNYIDKAWAIGQLARTAWIDSSEANTVPVATGPSGYLYNHETGTDDDGSAMTAYVETGDFDLEDGNAFMFVDRIVPDFERLTGSVDFTFKVRDYPMGTQTTKGPLNMVPTTRFKDFRTRGRQAAVRLSSDDLGDDWRYGTIRIRVRPDGGR